MGACITLAGESLIAQKHVAQQGLDVTRFIFANVPGLYSSGPVDRAAPKPVAAQIVHVYEIPKENAGYVNPNQVVYSSQIGSDIGDWDFNWIGLETAEGILFAVAYVPLQIKRRNIPPLQVGNNLTRNFLVAFDGAQMLTGITIDASTWQHDFTVRLSGIDERERLSNRDVFGRACFLGSALQLEKVAGVYQLKPGTAYIEGIRLTRVMALPVVPKAFPCTAWIDLALQREFSDVVASWEVVFAADLQDYIDSTGTRHYCVPIADIVNNNTFTDRRSVEPIDGPLVSHFAARTGDYPKLRARATTKDDVGLGNLPNAKSDDSKSDSSEILATTKALAEAQALLYQALSFKVGLYSTVPTVQKEPVIFVQPFGLMEWIAAHERYRSIEVGSVILHSAQIPRPGTLKANGQTLSKTSYHGLWSYAQDNGLVVPPESWVPGAIQYADLGPDIFRGPDLRSQFLRAWDESRGIDPGRGFGTAQDGTLLPSMGVARHTSTTAVLVTPAATGVLSDGQLFGAQGYESPVQVVTSNYFSVPLSLTGSSSVVRHSIRPRNTALLACLKY